MHSLLKRVAVGTVVVSGVWGAPVAEITAAPSIDVLAERQNPDAVSLAQILLTAIPESLRQIAATDLLAVSSILWEDFLDDNRPDWFLELPSEIQNYLVRKFGPQSAWPTEAPASSQDDGMWRPSASATTTSDELSARTSVPTSMATSVSSASSESSGLTSSASKSTASKSTVSQSPSHSSDHSSHITFSSSNLAQPSSTPSSTPTPDAPAASTSGLSKDQKIGIGLGIPIGLLAACALFLACCTLCRRRRKRHVEGSIPPASPGFIPRFAFQEKHENTEYRTPLNRVSNTSTTDFGTAWDDEGIDPHENAHVQNPYAWNDRGAYNTASGAAPFAAAAAYTALDNESDSSNNHHNNAPAMALYDPKPIMAPALYHTHSSNRARGRRTSYTSLASLDAVTEVTEPDDMDSPVLGRHASYYQSKNQSPGRKLVPASTPTTPAMAQIKRKPVPPSPPLPPTPMSPSRVATSPAAHAASQKLLRQTMPEHSGSSSSGLALSTSSGVSSTSALGVNEEPVSPISPVSLSNRAASNPFQYDSYVEDYGPEYHNGYVDVDDGWYGGNTSLSQYPETRKKMSRTEWPLRNLVGSHHRRKSSPLWERVYEE